MRILIVDDFFISRQVVENALQARELTDISVARDGLAALQMIEAAQKSGASYDIVFLDHNMPKMEGIEVAKRVKGKPEFAALSIIMISAEANQAKIKEALAAGVEAYMLKPVTEEKIVTKLDEVIAARKQRDIEAHKKKSEAEIKKEEERKKYNLPPA